MPFVDVVVATSRAKIDKPLTYKTDGDIPVGSVVRVPLGKRTLNGVVISKAKAIKGAKAILAVIDVAPLSVQAIEFAKQLSKYYAANLSDSFSLLIPAGIEKKRRSVYQAKQHTKLKLPAKLTSQQQKAIDTINHTEAEQTVILHGETGSGKTIIYRKLVDKIISSGKSAILLVPEISLTTQFVQYFTSVEAEVFVLHSKLSEAEKHLLWVAVQQSEQAVVIGPRSALFAPIKNLGLIIIDESHEASYRQEQSPKYHAARAARILANQYDANVVLGSATPNLEDLFIAKNRTNPVITLPALNKHKYNVKISVVNITTQKLQGGIFSNEASEQIDKTLQDKQQVLIFHNRRGTSNSVICSNCGEIESCPNCELPLIHHADHNQLRCHICNYRQRIRLSCQKCGSADYIYRGYGTKEIESYLKTKYPKKRTIRFDADSKSDQRLEEVYDKLRSGYYDIIIGTQIVAKGLDLPKLGCVIVPNVDSMLTVPDYTSNERVFNLLYQAKGRIGRHQDGAMIMQTRMVNNPLIGYLEANDYDSFVSNELAWREKFEYPPYSFIISLVYRGKNQTRAQKTAEKLAMEIRKMSDITVLGPAPAFRYKQAGYYRWQLIVKSKNRTKLSHIAKALPSGWQAELDPISLLS